MYKLYVCLQPLALQHHTQRVHLSARRQPLLHPWDVFVYAQVIRLRLPCLRCDLETRLLFVSLFIILARLFLQFN